MANVQVHYGDMRVTVFVSFLFLLLCWCPHSAPGRRGLGSVTHWPQPEASDLTPHLLTAQHLPFLRLLDSSLASSASLYSSVVPGRVIVLTEQAERKGQKVNFRPS